MTTADHLTKAGDHGEYFYRISFILSLFCFTKIKLFQFKINTVFTVSLMKLPLQYSTWLYIHVHVHVISYSKDSWCIGSYGCSNVNNLSYYIKIHNYWSNTCTCHQWIYFFDNNHNNENWRITLIIYHKYQTTSTVYILIITVLPK